jgi:hypothetical protein
MRWLDFPPLAEFTDRSGFVRRIYGPTILGRFEFADRLNDISQALGRLDADQSWETAYLRDVGFRHSIDRALRCWGLDPDWLAPSQIEQLLFCRGDEPGWLSVLLGSAPLTDQPESKTQTLAETLGSLAKVTASVTEAIDLANTIPADLLVDMVTAMGDDDTPKTKVSDKADDYIKANFDKLMGVI